MRGVGGGCPDGGGLEEDESGTAFRGGLGLGENPDAPLDVNA